MNVRLPHVAAICSLLIAACSGGDPDAPAKGITPGGGGTKDPPATSSGGSGGTPTTPTTPTTPSTPTQSDTWNDGKVLTSSVDIVAGAVITIAPGAKITANAGVTITVHGAIEAAAKDKHAKISGTGWGGIVVATGGALTLSGVDLDGGGIQANTGNKAATYDYGTITTGAFVVDKGAKLDTHHAAFVQGGSTTVSGAFTASYLDYAGSDITLLDPAATVSVADSKLTASGGDFFVSSSGALLHVEYSVITGSHCPFHFNALGKYTLDHVATRGNGYGQMFYNPESTPNTISYSSFEDPSFDQTGRSNEIDIDHSYIKAKSTVGIVKITTPASSPVAAAAPRGTPGPKG